MVSRKTMGYFLLLLLLSPLARGADFDPSLLGGGAPQRFPHDLSVGAKLYGTVTQGQGDIGIEEGQIQFRKHFSEGSLKSFSLSGKRNAWHSSALFPKSNLTIPSNLSEAGIALNYSWPKDNGITHGLALSFGSQSDRPFYSWREDSLGINYAYSFPDNERDKWIIVVNWSSNRSFLPYIPLPGFAYSWKRENWNLVAGLPFLFYSWRPTKKWLLIANFFLIDSGMIELNYFLFGPARIGLGFRSGHEQFFRAGRDDAKDKIFYRERSSYLRFLFPATQSLSTELTAAYISGRTMRESKHLYDRDEARRIDLKDTWSVLAKLNWGF